MPMRSDSRSLPQRWRRGRERAALILVAVMALLCGALAGQGGAEGLDSWWLRARFSGREALENATHRARSNAVNARGKASIQAAQDAHQGIVMVEIDDRCVTEWSSEPTLMWGGHIADALNTITRSGARSVALDWTQSVETDAAFGWGNDAKLGAALSRAPRVTMVKMVASNGKYVLPTSSLLFAVPGAVEDGGKNVLGLADLLNQSSVQTSFFTHIENEITFPALIAKNSGLEVPPGPPPREGGSWLIHYRPNAGQLGARAPWQRLSLLGVARAKGTLPLLKNKIVLIGVNYKGTNDLHFVPFLSGLSGSRQIPGLEVQASILATILAGDAITEPGRTLIGLLATALGALGIGALTLWSWNRAAAAIVALGVTWIIASFGCFCALNLALPAVLPLVSLLLGAGAMGGYRALSEERERAQIMKIVGRYQDPRIINEFLAHPEWSGGQGHELFVTVLFADLKDFTKTVEHLSPSDSLEALNRYLSLLSTAILRNDGLVDKYLGDGLMAQWGAPKARPDHAALALKTCLEIMGEVQQLTRQIENAAQVSFEVRLTLHTGFVVAGPIGSAQRLEYTLIGDTVNVCSRLQETAKALGCDFLISQTTFEALHETPDELPLGSDVNALVSEAVGCNIGRETTVEIRGRTQPLRVFEVLGALDSSSSAASSSVSGDRLTPTANSSQIA